MMDEITLRIYRAPSGQWAGKVLSDDGQEIAGVAGCTSPEEVEYALAEVGFNFDPDDIEVTA